MASICLPSSLLLSPRRLAFHSFPPSTLAMPSSLKVLSIPRRQTLTVCATSDEAEESTSSPAPASPKKPTFTLNKGQIVRVDKEKYLSSVEYLAVGHPPYFKGLDYIYEDRGEVLDVRMFDTGEYALIGWAGIPTSPAWLPTYMLIKAEKLSYKRT